MIADAEMGVPIPPRKLDPITPEETKGLIERFRFETERSICLLSMQAELLKTGFKEEREDTLINAKAIESWEYVILDHADQLHQRMEELECLSAHIHNGARVIRLKR